MRTNIVFFPKCTVYNPFPYQGNRISATNVHLKLMIATLGYQTSANPYARDSNHRGKRLKIFKCDRPGFLTLGFRTIAFELLTHL